MTHTTTANVTQEQADQLIQDAGFGEMVEESEINELGHVYTLTNGEAIIVTFDGRIILTESTVLFKVIPLIEDYTWVDDKGHSYRLSNGFVMAIPIFGSITLERGLGINSDSLQKTAPSTVVL